VVPTPPWCTISHIAIIGANEQHGSHVDRECGPRALFVERPCIEHGGRAKREDDGRLALTQELFHFGREILPARIAVIKYEAGDLYIRRPVRLRPAEKWRKYSKH
jgi:hypothetical protein